MRKILLLILLVSGVAHAQFMNTGARRKIFSGTGPSSCSNIGLPVSDTFAGTGTLDPTCWSQTSTPGFQAIVKSSGHAIVSSAGYGYAIFTGSSLFGSNSYSQVTINSAGANYSGPCLLDITASGACYLYTLNEVVAITNGGGVGSISTCSAFVNGHSYAIDYGITSGGSFTVFDATTNTQICAPTAASPPAGIKPAISIYGSDTLNAFSGGSAYFDNFQRANAVLSAPWAEPIASSTQGDLQIISNQVLAHGTQPGAHYLDIYTGGNFNSNQYSIITVNNVATSGSGATQGAVVRGKTLNQYYNDAVPNITLGNLNYFLGIDNGTDFCNEIQFQTGFAYTAGDTHELDVVGTNPTFFWSRHNGTIEATCLDSATNYTGGVPGLGSVVDMNSTPTVALGAWRGGSLVTTTGSNADNFVRSNAGWLGPNWWFATTDNTGGNGFDCGFTISSNQALLNGGGGTCSTNHGGAALWTAPFGSAQQAVVTIGTIASGGYEGPIVRAHPAQLNSGETFYTAIYFSGSVLLYAYSGSNFHLLSTVGSTSTPTTLELDASGTSPVALSVKVNGSAFGSTFNDSTYLLTGSYEGFTAFTNPTTVAGWTGH